MNYWPEQEQQQQQYQQYQQYQQPQGGGGGGGFRPWHAVLIAVPIVLILVAVGLWVGGVFSSDGGSTNGGSAADDTQEVDLEQAEEEVRETVEDFADATEPEAICDFFSGEGLERFGGPADCVRSQPNNIEPSTVEFQDVDVSDDGQRAQVEAEFSVDGNVFITLERVGDEWQLIKFQSA